MDGATSNEPIEGAANVQIGDVLVDKIGFKDDESDQIWNKNLMMLHLSSIIIEHFKRK